MKLYKNTAVLLNRTLEVDFTTIDNYAKGICSAVTNLINNHQDKFTLNKNMYATHKDAIYFCESDELMIAIAQLVITHTDYKIYLDNPEENYELGSSELITKFKQDNKERILEDINNQETFNNAILILGGNSYTGCDYNHFTNGTTKVLVACTLPIKDPKKLYMYNTNEIYPRAIDTFSKDSSVFQLSFKTKEDYLLENEEKEFHAHLRNTYVRDTLLTKI